MDNVEFGRKDIIRVLSGEEIMSGRQSKGLGSNPSKCQIFYLLRPDVPWPWAGQCLIKNDIKLNYYIKNKIKCGHSQEILLTKQ